MHQSQGEGAGEGGREGGGEKGGERRRGREGGTKGGGRREKWGGEGGEAGGRGGCLSHSQGLAGGRGGGGGVPWTLNVYSARALCFLGFFPKTNSEIGFSFGASMRKAFYRIASWRSFHGRPPGRHGQGRGFGTFCWERGVAGSVTFG